jgi:hypothetical protein
MNGWVKLHRIIMDWEWYNDPNMVHLFLHLILSANHKPVKWQGETIEIGQLVTGLNALSEKTGISVQSLRTCLNRLKSTGEITSRSTNKFTIITVCKYECYQSENDDTNNQINKPSNKRSTNNQQTINNKQEDKNVRSKEEEVKKAYAPNVFLKPSEFETFKKKYGLRAIEWMIEKLSAYKEANGKTYKSDSAAIRSWVADKWTKEMTTPTGTIKSKDLGF